MEMSSVFPYQWSGQYGSCLDPYLYVNDVSRSFSQCIRSNSGRCGSSAEYSTMFFKFKSVVMPLLTSWFTLHFIYYRVAVQCPTKLQLATYVCNNTLYLKYKYLVLLPYLFCILLFLFQYVLYPDLGHL